MRTVVVWTLAVLAGIGLAWQARPEGSAPDLSPFADGGSSLREEMPEWPLAPPSVRLRYAAMRRCLGAVAGLWIVAVAAGLFLRERRRYASPTLAWLGKRGGLAGVAALAVFVLAPVDWGVGALFAGAVAAATGIATYVGNLPRKL